MRVKRHWHMAFKMNGSVYVVGGHSGTFCGIYGVGLAGGGGDGFILLYFILSH